MARTSIRQSQGMPELRQAVAAHNERFYGLEMDWQTQVLVTSGATEAVAASLLALLNPGDEVVLFEPMYDCYLPMAQLAGAMARAVRLRPPAWDLPREALRAACNDKTKLIVLNSPMNPTGKVFDREALQFIADLAIQHDALVVCDEVYEHLTFDGAPHIPLMTLPGMEGRCIRIGSAGKSFSLTGWKVGYITAPPALADIICKAHQFLTFTTAPNLQRAVAYGLGKDDAYFTGLAAQMQAKPRSAGRRLAPASALTFCPVRAPISSPPITARSPATAKTTPPSANASRWRPASPPCRSAPSAWPPCPAELRLYRRKN